MSQSPSKMWTHLIFSTKDRYHFSPIRPGLEESVSKLELAFRI